MTTWQYIAECLRAELADYGELLRLFEEQQRSLFSREPDAVLHYANEIEAQAFCRLAARRFKYLYQEKDVAALVSDPEHLRGKATLISLVKGVKGPRSYAPIYR